MPETVNIEDYREVTRTATCKRCNSKTVTWVQKPGSTKREGWYLCEVFEISGEELFSPRDFHSYYCVGGNRSHTVRRSELLHAATGEEPQPEPEPERQESPQHTKSAHFRPENVVPHICLTCGEGIYDDTEDLYRNYVDNKPHTCPAVTTPVMSWRKLGAIRAAKVYVKFVDISTRMSAVESQLRILREENRNGDENKEAVQLGAEFLQLNWRLHTEIP